MAAFEVFATQRHFVRVCEHAKAVSYMTTHCVESINFKWSHKLLPKVAKDKSTVIQIHLMLNSKFHIHLCQNSDKIRDTRIENLYSR